MEKTSFSTLFDDVITMVSHFASVQLSHIWLEENQCADWATSYEKFTIMDCMIWLLNYPFELLHLGYQDTLDVVHVRVSI